MTLHCQYVHAPSSTPAGADAAVTAGTKRATAVTAGTRRDSSVFSELGINVEKPDSNNGEISVTYDWKKVE